MSYSLSLKDFEPECFTLEKYVEKLAQLNPHTGLGPLSKSTIKPFDPDILLKSFEDSIQTLKELGERNQRRVEKLEQVCATHEKEHTDRTKELETTYQECFNEFQLLEDRITYVATKVVHLGDQLESSNNRRMRGIEAQELMRILTEFHHKAKPSLPVFTDPNRKLEAADLIFKLNGLAGDLPNTQQYETVKRNISEKYVEIEKQLVDEFIEAERSLDNKRMKQYAAALQPFGLGSHQVIENYIHHNLPATPFASADDMFTSVEKMCKKVHDQIVDIFDNPDLVMTKFVQVVIDKVLMRHIDGELGHLSQNEVMREKYLRKLNDLYSKTMHLAGKMGKYEMSIDPSSLLKMTRVTLFSKYLSTYASTETAHLMAKCTQILDDFNEMVGTPGRRVIGVSRLTMSSGRSPDETYVSQEVCTSVLHEAKGAIRRAQMLLSDRELSELVRDLYFTVLRKLCQEHFNTALDLAISADPKSSPTGLFCLVVGSVNSNMHLIEKLFREVVMPCIHYPPVATACVDRKRMVTSKLEGKINAGVERTISGMVTCVRQLLSIHQKKTDYRPENLGVMESTQACVKVVNYVKECCTVLKTSLDGKNLEVVLHELGTRLHRVLYENIQQFSINENGAMVIICDMNEYRKAIKEFKNPFLDELFEGLQALCNIFIVRAENLSQVCSEEPYVTFDRSVLAKMAELRADYKTARLAKHFS